MGGSIVTEKNFAGKKREVEFLVRWLEVEKVVHGRCIAAGLHNIFFFFGCTGLHNTNFT